jgi:ankyrin repeat protein
MNVQRFELPAMVLAMVSVAIGCGCRPTAAPVEGRSMKQIPPGEFYTDPLHVRLAAAVDAGDAAAVEAAVRDGADVHAWGKDGYSILYWAMARRNVSGFEALLKNGADVTSDYRAPAVLKENRLRDFIVRLTLEVADPGFLKAALRQGLDPDYVLDKDSNESLLFLAGRRHNEPALQLLLDSGAAMDHQDHNGYTTLGEATLRCDFKTMWFLMERGADLTVKNASGHDVSWQLREYGSRGVLPEQREYFEKVVDELVRRGLLTRQDIVEADKPKTPNSGITVIEHAADSEAGRAISELDRREHEANARDRAK